MLRAEFLHQHRLAVHRRHTHVQPEQEGVTQRIGFARIHVQAKEVLRVAGSEPGRLAPQRPHAVADRDRVIRIACTHRGIKPRRPGGDRGQLANAGEQGHLIADDVAAQRGTGGDRRGDRPYVGRLDGQEFFIKIEVRRIFQPGRRPVLAAHVADDGSQEYADPCGLAKRHEAFEAGQHFGFNTGFGRHEIRPETESAHRRHPRGANQLEFFGDLRFVEVAPHAGAGKPRPVIAAKFKRRLAAWIDGIHYFSQN